MSEPVAHHPDPDTAVRFRVSVLVCAHNEERSLPTLLRAALAQDGPSFTLRELIVVASGCTDGTVQILEAAARAEPRVRVFIEPVRQGKAAAMARAIAVSRSELLLIENADTVPAPGAYERMLSPFHDPSVGLVCCHPIPSNSESKFTVRVGRLLWEVHDAVSRSSPRAGEAFALRRPSVRVPEDIEDDDTFLGAIAVTGGYRATYAPDAVIANRVPTHPRELFQQRFRINRQLLGLRRRTGIVSSTWDPVVFLGALALFVRAERSRWSELVGLVALEGAARVSAFVVAEVRRAPLRSWTPLPSTKGATAPSPIEG